MKRKWSTIALTAVLVLGMLTGCQGGTAVSEDKGAQPAPDGNYEQGMLQPDGTDDGKVVLKVWAE